MALVRTTTATQAVSGFYPHGGPFHSPRDSVRHVRHFGSHAGRHSTCVLYGTPRLHVSMVLNALRTARTEGRDGEHARAAVVHAGREEHAAFVGAHSQDRGPCATAEKKTVSHTHTSLSPTCTMHSQMRYGLRGPMTGALVQAFLVANMLSYWVTWGVHTPSTGTQVLSPLTADAEMVFWQERPVRAREPFFHSQRVSGARDQ